LGNFVFDHTYIPTTRESFIAEITIGELLDLITVNIIPVITDESDYQPQLLDPPQAEVSIKRVDAIRSKFEDRPLLDYIESIGDYDLLYRKYKRPAKRKMKVQFLKNFYRYSPSTTFGMIKEYFSKQRVIKHGSPSDYETFG